MLIAGEETAAVGGGLARFVERSLRADWRMIERVDVHPRREGNGIRVTIFLNRILIQASAEQQGLRAAAELSPRMLAVVAACVERLNTRLPAGDSIREFQVGVCSRP